MIPRRLCLAFLLFSLSALATRPGPSAKRPETVPSSHPAVQSAARFALTEYLKRGAFSSTISAWKGSSIEVVRARKQLVDNSAQPHHSSKNFFIEMTLMSLSGRCATHDVHVIKYRTGTMIVVSRHVSEHQC